MEARDLWAQMRVRSRELNVTKVGSEDNKADLLEKFMDLDRHHMFLKLFPLSAPGAKRSGAPPVVRVGVTCL